MSSSQETSPTSPNRPGQQSDDQSSHRATPSSSNPLAQSLQPPFEPRRPQSGSTIATSRYPSANEDYIGSYYYGTYDSDFVDDANSSRDISAGPSAGPSSSAAWASAVQNRTNSPAASPRFRRLSNAGSDANARDQVAEGVTFGPESARLHSAQERQQRTASADITSWGHHLASNLESPSAEHIILASPEELQASDYFSSAARAGPSSFSRSGLRTPQQHSGQPGRSRTSSGVDSITMMGASGGWNASDSDVGSPGAPASVEGETAALRFHPSAPGYGGAGKRKASDPVAADSPTPPRQGKYVGFAPPQVAFVSSPSALEDQTPDNRPGESHYSSADDYRTPMADSRRAVDSAKSGINRFSKSIKRMSRRVVDMNNGADDGLGVGHIRLVDNDSSDEEDERSPFGDNSATARPTPPSAPSHQPTPLEPFGLRGKSLGFMGPENKFRKALAKLLAHWWVEPLILVLIVTNVICLIIQASRNVFEAPREPGYFDYWEDSALLAIFCIYTVELVARIAVSGLVINPPQLYTTMPTSGSTVSFAPSTSGGARRESRPVEDMEVIETPDPGLRPSKVEDLATINRRRMSKSNTLDTWAELGGTLKSKAQSALRPQDASHSSSDRTYPSRNSTMISRMSTFDMDFRPSGSHQRSNTMGTMNTGKMSFRPAHATIPEGDDVVPSQPQAAVAPVSVTETQESSKILRSMHEKALPFAQAIISQRAQTPHYAFLRHSWNRVDFVAVCSFWIMFFLSLAREELTDSHHIYVFRALSVLRVARLLTVTSGTSTILQSLKLAAPLLSNVLFFTVFAMVLFSIIGIQSFKGSYRRSCVWVGDLNSGIDAEPGQNYTLSQICGSWYDGDHRKQPYVQSSGRLAALDPKGYTCPVGQMCVEATSNPNENSQSFDNIFTSLLEVVIVISSNGWSGVMYDMIDADYFVSAIYFIIGLIFLNFWLANLFVAVITNCFATISAQTHQSAFAAKNIEGPAVLQDQPESNFRRRRKKVANVYKKVWGFTKYIWLAAIVADLGSQASRASYDSTAGTQFVKNAELYFTIAFDVEILLRFISYLLDDDWRSFFGPGVQGTRNKVDAGLCVITSIIQIPAILNSSVYPWLTIFQLQRFYRVIIAIPRIEALLLRVFGSFSGLFNMILFLLLTVGLAAIMAVQLFRGDISAENDGDAVEMTFKQIYNGYLAMYQIFTSENWNDVLFDVISDETTFKQAVIAGIFLSGWFLFANFIVLQMFIAVINEGFSISEAEKKRQQLDLYVKRLEPAPMSLSGRIIHKMSPYRWLKDHNASILGQPKSTSQPLTGTTDGVRRAFDNIDEKNRRRLSIHRLINPSGAQRGTRFVRRLLRLDDPYDTSMPLDTVRQRQVRQSFSGAEMLQTGTGRRSFRQPSMYEPDNNDEAARLFARDRQLNRMRTDLGLPGEKPTQSEIDAEHVARYEENPRIAMAKAINEHPSFDKSLWMFSNHSHFRRFCQSIVPASYGERIFGRQHSRRRYLAAQIIVFGAIVASVVVAGFASPLYRKDWYAQHGFKRDSWFSLTEVFLSLVFFVEFFIKVVADGFAFTPNAYLLSPWNLLDLLVLASLVVNVTTELVVIGGVSRFTRSLKAFRALRLINLSTLMRSTFANLVVGGGRFIDAAILAVLYIIPFAVWGQNLFSGLLYACTDDGDGISTKSDCVGEYSASPSEWSFLAPRVWQNPTSGSAYSFDDFKSALLILFEIVSLEGWIDVMTAAMAIVGQHQQPSPDARQVNALFFVIYNLIGAIFVLTLFVSVIIEGFQSATGAAFLSTEQRQWIDLKRLISRQRPSKRPLVKPTGRLRAWCFARATKKHDWWGRLMTFLYVANIITLCTQSYTQPASAERIRDGFYLGFAILYCADVVIRFLGLGWTAFRRSLWCLYDSFMVLGIIGTTLSLILTAPTQLNIQLQKFFLTAATLKLVAKHNGLNQLFKTAISGLPAIASLLGLWLCFFLFFSIMFVEVFGLTKWGYVGPETYARNFSSMPLALIFLSMISTGEGWNGYMHDYTVEPPNCTPSANYLETDCGSTGWAYSLFIAWNVVSMYIFLNMFTGTVVENFSYIFQLGGKPILGREDMRGFKRTWMDTVGPGSHLPQEKLVQFLRALPGKFEVRIYPAQYDITVLREAATMDDNASVSSLAPTSKKGGVAGAVSRLRGVSASPTKDSASASTPSSGHFVWPPGTVRSRYIDGINVSRLANLIESIDPEEIQIRRERFNRLYHEACIIAEEDEEGKGISFNAMLTLIAHYKLIDESALGMEELVERRQLEEKIDDRRSLERLRGVMRMTYLRYRFKTLRSERQRASAEIAASSQTHLSQTGDTLPTITVERTQSPPAPYEGDEDVAVGSHEAKPDLKIDLNRLRGGLGGGGLRTPPAQTGAESTYSLLHGDNRLSPSSSSQRSGPGTPVGPGAEPSLEELERRASPLLESFGESAWGKIMHRVSNVTEDLRLRAGSSRATSPHSQRSTKSGSDSASGKIARALTSGRSKSPSTPTRPSSSSRGWPASASTSAQYYTLDSHDAWASEPRIEGALEQEGQGGIRHVERSSPDEDEETPDEKSPSARQGYF